MSRPLSIDMLSYSAIQYDDTHNKSVIYRLADKEQGIEDLIAPTASEHEQVSSLPYGARASARGNQQVLSNYIAHFINWYDSPGGGEWRDFIAEETPSEKGSLDDYFKLDGFVAGNLGKKMIMAVNVEGKRILYFNTDLMEKNITQMQRLYKNLSRMDIVHDLFRHETDHLSTPDEVLNKGSYAAEKYTELRSLAYHIGEMQQAKSRGDKKSYLKEISFAHNNTLRYLWNTGLEQAKEGREVNLEGEAEMLIQYLRSEGVSEEDIAMLTNSAEENAEQAVEAEMQEAA
ncbi:MAG: hypothetical protein ABIH34_04415 [Nanoarchaeota archaeon]